MVKRGWAGLALLSLLTLGASAQEAAKAPQRDKEAEKIEEFVAGLLDTHRAGSYNLMEHYYAPEVVMVSARHEPPLVGWAKVRQAYIAQEANIQHFELVRDETRIDRRGKLAWVYYRWTSVVKARDQYVTVFGHTTLILEKRGGKWLIVYNHTSAAPPAPEPRPAAPAPPRP